MKAKTRQQKKKKKAKTGPYQSAEDCQSLLHELQLHQFELKMQNNELQKTLVDLEDSRTKYSDLYNFAPIGYFNIDRDGMIREINFTGANMLEVERVSLINMPFSRFVHKDDKDTFYLHHNSMLKTMSQQNCEISLIKKDGSYFDAHLECLPVKGRTKNISFIRIAVMDISDRKQAEKEIYDMAKFPLENPFPVIRVSNDGMIIFANDASQSMLRNWNCKVGNTLPDNIRQLFFDDPDTDLKRRFEFELEDRVISFNVVPVPGANYINLYGTDITERNNMVEQLQVAAITDDLTGLLNRRGFYTLAEQQCKLSDRTGGLLTLLYMDLNNMKEINDKLGHKTGDQALIDVADILKTTFRKSDIIARIGGDEFAVFLVEHTEGVNNIITYHLDENVKIHNKQAGRNYKLALSTGISQYNPEHSCSIEDLLTLADRLMYKDKRIRKLEAFLEHQFKEHRAYERYKPTDILPLLLDASVEVSILDISQGGISLMTSHQLIRGNHHLLNDISDGTEKLTAKCLVMWSAPAQMNANNKGPPVYEAGLKFSDLNKSELHSLESIISHLPPL